MDFLHSHNDSMETKTLDEEDGLARRMFSTGLLVDKYYTPLLCLLGALGNSLSLTVFCLDGKYRRQSSSYYLCALAVSDSGFLLNLFAVWLEMVWGGVITAHALACPLVMYLGQVTCFASVYLTVAFTLERYIAINFPFSRPRLCTKSKAKKVIAGVAGVALLLFSYAWVIAEVVEIPRSTAPATVYANESLFACPDLASQNNSQDWLAQLPFKNSSGAFGTLGCGILSPNSTELPFLSGDNEENGAPSFMCTVPERYFVISEIANYVDSAVTLIIPFLLITFFNVRIGMSVWRLGRERKYIMASFATTLHATMIVTTSGGSAQAQRPSSSSSGLKSATPKQGSSPRVGPGISGHVSPEKVGPGESNPSPRAQSSKRDVNISNSFRFHAQLPAQSQQPPSSEVRVTKTLLLVSTVFLVLNLPLHAIRCTQFIQTATGTPEGQDILLALQPWANMLFNTNFAVNFLLYCVAGRNFRKTLRVIAKRVLQGKQPKTPFHQQQQQQQYSTRR